MSINKWINKMWLKKKERLAILYRGQYLPYDMSILSCPSKENGYVDRYPPWIYWHYKNMSC